MFYFYTHWKTKGFLMFSEDTELEHWLKMSWWLDYGLQISWSKKKCWNSCLPLYKKSNSKIYAMVICLQKTVKYLGWKMVNWIMVAKYDNFPAFELKAERCNMRIRITPNTDTFYSVRIFMWPKSFFMSLFIKLSHRQDLNWTTWVLYTFNQLKS